MNLPDDQPPFTPPDKGEVVSAEVVSAEVVDADGVEGSTLDTRGRIGHPVIAWLVVAGIATLIVLRVAFAPEPDEKVGQVTERWQSRVMQWQGKYLVGAAELPTLEGEQLFSQADALDTGPIENRLKYVVLAGELIGAEKAAAHLEELRRRVGHSPTEPTATQVALMDALEKLYDAHQRQAWAAPSVEPTERELLKSQLDWFGRLALYPEGTPDTAQRQAVVNEAVRLLPAMIVSALIMLATVVTSLAGCVLFLILIGMKRLGSRLEPRVAFGNIYMEAFAVWLVLHVGAGLAFALVRLRWPDLPIWRQQITLSALGMTLSGLALFWPWMRGVSWTRLRHDIGLTRARNLAWEALLGVGGWIATLPIMVLVLLLTVAVFGMFTGQAGEPADPFAPQPLPAHPIVQWVMDAGWAGRLLIAVMACVLAPVLEEIMFRGFLYRHLREASIGWRMARSVTFSALLSSSIFAAIHPQGLIAVPSLATLAVAFCLLREWRGSLVAPIVGHAANNGVITLILLTIVA